MCFKSCVRWVQKERSFPYLTVLVPNYSVVFLCNGFRGRVYANAHMLMQDFHSVVPLANPCAISRQAVFHHTVQKTRAAAPLSRARLVCLRWKMMWAELLVSSRRKRTQTEGSLACAAETSAPASASTDGGTNWRTLLIVTLPCLLDSCQVFLLTQELTVPPCAFCCLPETAAMHYGREGQDPYFLFHIILPLRLWSQAAQLPFPGLF